MVRASSPWASGARTAWLARMKHVTGLSFLSFSTFSLFFHTLLISLTARPGYPSGCFSFLIHTALRRGHFTCLLHFFSLRVKLHERR